MNNSTKQSVVTENAKQYPHLLSQAIISNGFIFTAGYVHVTADGTLVEGSTEDKVHQIMRNLQEVLKAANADFSHVIKVNIYVTDIEFLAKLNEVYVTYFSAPLPVREAVCVKALPLGASIEMSMVASV